jgi:hypothetical protein
MKEIHGVADAKKIMMVGETDDTDVRIEDGNGRVILISPDSPVSLTPEHARAIAEFLRLSANRVETKP